MAGRITRVSPVLGVPRVRQAAEYYRDVLGFALDPIEGVFQPSPAEPDGVYAIVRRGEIWIHFQIRREWSSAGPRQPLERDLYLYVENVNGFYQELVRRGAKILCEPADAPYGIREFVIEDLNGFRIAFGEANSSS